MSERKHMTWYDECGQFTAVCLDNDIMPPPGATIARQSTGEAPHPWTLAARQARAKAAHRKAAKKTAKKALRIIEKVKKGGRP